MTGSRLALALALGCAAAPVLAQTGDGDWPSYNRTLTGEHFSSLAVITPGRRCTVGC